MDDNDQDVSPRGFDRHRPDAAIHQAFVNEPVPIGVNAEDGLPSPLPTQADACAPPLSLDTLVCLADERLFVKRDEWGYVTKHFTREVVELTPNGEWRVKDGHGSVEPVRPQCKHFARQLIDFEGDGKKGMVERLCTARRDSQGEFLSLRDAQMVACELREPRDPESEEHLRRYDELRLKQGAARRAAGEGMDLSKIGYDPDADLEGVIE